jgi:hypothetical protein
MKYIFGNNKNKLKQNQNWLLDYSKFSSELLLPMQPVHNSAKLKCSTLICTNDQGV